MSHPVQAAYVRKIRRLDVLTRKLTKIFTLFSLLRFGSFLTIFALPAVAYSFDLLPMDGGLWLAALPGLALFIVFFFLHSRIKAKLQEAKNQNLEYESCRVRLSPDWARDLPVDPETPENLGDHAYAGDLSLFGQFSLFQYMDRTSSLAGRRFLKELFLSQPDDVTRDLDSFTERTTTVRELARAGIFRIRFRRLGRILREEEGDLDVPKWLAGVRSVKISGLNSLLVWPARILPFVTLFSYILFSMKILPAYFLVSIPVQILMFIWAHMQATEASKNIAYAALHLKGHEQLFAACEKFNPHSPGLEKLSLFHEKPADKFKTLAQLAGLYAMRMNPFAHIIFGVFFSYEIHLMHRTAGWLEQHLDSLPRWFEDLATVDALLCLGEFERDHPDYIRPELTLEKEGGPIFEAQELAHPLLQSSERVANSFEFSNESRLWLISGSNMSGKSTFMRTLGMNLILAQLGAPVCAAKFRFRPLRLRTSMHQVDDLSRSISLFYSEVRRIKQIMDAAHSPDLPLFFLIDEMLRGTNTRERQIACRSILAELQDLGAAGIVTTHDTGMLQLCNKESKVRCLHFEEIIQGGRMTFDYKLKDGPVQSSNALQILEMEGIHIHQDPT